MLLLETVVGEARLELDEGVLFDHPTSGLTVVHEELLLPNLNCLPFLEIANYASHEIWLDCIVHHLRQLLVLVQGYLVQLSLALPKRR